MVNVSKRAVADKVVQDIADQLIIFFARAHTKKEAAALFYELLTPAERLQLAKRLATIIFLEEGVPFHVIEETLCVSPATIAKFDALREEGRYRKVLRALRRKKYDESFSGLIAKLIDAGLPPQGKGRWRRVFRE